MHINRIQINSFLLPAPAVAFVPRPSSDQVCVLPPLPISWTTWERVERSGAQSAPLVLVCPLQFSAEETGESGRSIVAES